MNNELAQPLNRQQEEENKFLENLTPQQSKQLAQRVAELMQNSASETLDLTNLPFDPAQAAMQGSASTQSKKTQ